MALFSILQSRPEAVKRAILCGLVALMFVPILGSRVAPADTSSLQYDARAALNQLYATSPKARGLGARATAVLIFPKVVKVGFMVGALSGNGALFEQGRVTRFFNISAASFGFQAGAQTYSYALFFITNSGLQYLKNSRGWSVGVGPSVVVLDKGWATSQTSTTLTQDVYAIVYGQSGLMAGAGLEGSKISPINP